LPESIRKSSRIPTKLSSMNDKQLSRPNALPKERMRVLAANVLS